MTWPTAKANPVRLWWVFKRSQRLTGDSLYVLAGYVLLVLIYLYVVVLDRRILAFIVVLDRRMRVFCRGVRPLKTPLNHRFLWKTSARRSRPAAVIGAGAERPQEPRTLGDVGKRQPGRCRALLGILPWLGGKREPDRIRVD